MFDEIERFITQTKLRELRKQHHQLLESYDNLSHKIQEAEDDENRLRLLYHGLRALTFAKQPLHPDVANLEVILHEIDTHRISPEILTFWHTQLEQELARGRLLSEFVYLFGALLEEWALQNEDNTPPDSKAVRDKFVQQAGHVAEVGAYETILDNLEFPKIQRQKAIKSKLRIPVEFHELEPILQQLSNDNYRTVVLRNQAQRVLLNKTLLREMTDTLTIMLNSLEDWAWTSTGLPAQAFWTRQKWRLFIQDELPTACLLEIIGNRWQNLFNWNISKKTAKNHNPLTSRGQERGSILDQRASILQKLRDLNQLNGYSNEEYQTISIMETALMLIHAEIQIARAAFPKQPLYVVKIDLKDFYPSLSHEVLLTTLARFGVQERELDFFKRFLRIPIQDDNVQIMQRGVPNARRLSHFLGELVLRLLDQHIQQAAQVQVIRLIDDICLLTPSAEGAVTAWQAVQTFCDAFGLAIKKVWCGVHWW